MKTLLVLAYRFPDLVVPGGSTRVEKLVKYLPRHGVRPIVLSVSMPRDARLEPVHEGADVVRTPGHYGAFVRAYRTRHLEDAPRAKKAAIEIARRAKNLVLVPDDAVLWWPWAVPEVLRLVRRHRPCAVFASGPPFSGLLLGALAKRLTGLPFFADLRDDWAGNPLAGPRNVVQALCERPLERLAMRAADRVFHVTEASADLYRARYPELAERMRYLPNGFDEEDFPARAPREKRSGSLDLLHVGSLRGEGRSPAPLFRAIEDLIREDPRHRAVRISFAGTHHREHVAAAAGLNGQVAWSEPVPRARAVAWMAESDALLLLPSQDAPTAIPGKAYEYLRAGRPVLAVSAPNETTRFLARHSGVRVVDPGDREALVAVLREWFHAASLPAPDPRAVARYSRERIAGELAAHVAEVGA